MENDIIILILLIVIIIADWRLEVSRRRINELKRQLKAVPPTALAEIVAVEIEKSLLMMRLQAIEKFMANGFKLVYSHSVGICVRRKTDTFCVTLDEAILQDMANETEKI